MANIRLFSVSGLCRESTQPWASVTVSVRRVISYVVKLWITGLPDTIAVPSPNDQVAVLPAGIVAVKVWVRADGQGMTGFAEKLNVGLGWTVTVCVVES